MDPVSRTTLQTYMKYTQSTPKLRTTIYTSNKVIRKPEAQHFGVVENGETSAKATGPSVRLCKNIFIMCSPNFPHFDTKHIVIILVKFLCEVIIGG